LAVFKIKSTPLSIVCLILLPSCSSGEVGSVIFILIILIPFISYHYGLKEGEKKGEEKLKIIKYASEFRSNQLYHIRVLLPFLKRYFSQYGDSYEKIILNLANKFLAPPMGGHAYVVIKSPHVGSSTNTIFQEEDYPIEFPDRYRPRGDKMPVMTKFGEIAENTFHEMKPIRSEFINFFYTHCTDEERNNAKLETFTNRELYWVIFTQLIFYGILSWKYEEAEVEKEFIRTSPLVGFLGGGTKGFVYNSNLELDAFPENDLR